MKQFFIVCPVAVFAQIGLERKKGDS